MRNDLIKNLGGLFLLILIFGGIASISGYFAIKAYNAPNSPPYSFTISIPSNAEIVYADKFTSKSAGSKMKPSKPLAVSIHVSPEELIQLAGTSTHRAIVVISAEGAEYWLPRGDGSFYRSFYRIPDDEAKAPFGIDGATFSVIRDDIGEFMIYPRNDRIALLLSYGFMSLIFWAVVIIPICFAAFGKPPVSVENKT